MTAQATFEPVDITEIVERDPKPFILDTKAGEEFVERVREFVGAHPQDLTTEKGRAEIKSVAYKVGRAKSRIDTERKDMGAELRAQLKQINDAGNSVVKALADIQAEYRKPLTEWEEAEAQRKSRAETALQTLREVSQNPAPMGSSINDLQDRLLLIEKFTLDPADLGDDLAFAEKLKADTIEAVSSALEEAKKAEAEREELEALRREKAEREAKEREEAEAKARAEREAEEAKRREAEAERRAEEAAEKARQEERERIAAEKRAEEDARVKAQAEAERKAQDKRHRMRILSEVGEALEARFELSGPQAALIADAIAGGEIPHTSIQF